MSWDAFGAIGEWVEAIGVVVTLGFLVTQVRLSTVMMRRAEANSAQAQFSPYRQALMRDAELARLMSEGLQDPTTLGPVDRVRVINALEELTWASYQGWDRHRLGLSEVLYLTPLVTKTIGSPFGRIWWVDAKAAYPAAFCADVDRILDA